MGWISLWVLSSNIVTVGGAHQLSVYFPFVPCQYWAIVRLWYSWLPPSPLLVKHLYLAYICHNYHHIKPGREKSGIFLLLTRVSLCGPMSLIINVNWVYSLRSLFVLWSAQNSDCRARCTGPSFTSLGILLSGVSHSIPIQWVWYVDWRVFNWIFLFSRIFSLQSWLWISIGSRLITTYPSKYQANLALKHERKEI